MVSDPIATTVVISRRSSGFPSNRDSRAGIVSFNSHCPVTPKQLQRKQDTRLALGQSRWIWPRSWKFRHNNSPSGSARGRFSSAAGSGFGAVAIASKVPTGGWSFSASGFGNAAFHASLVPRLPASGIFLSGAALPQISPLGGSLTASQYSGWGLIALAPATISPLAPITAYTLRK